MSDTTTVSVRLDRKTKERLASLAETVNRPQSSLLAEAIEAYVDENERQIAEIRDAVEKADAGGPFAAHEDVERYMERRARGEKPERPKAYRR